MDAELVIQLALSASPEVLPILLCACVFMWNVAEDRGQANRCVDACVMIRHALATLGIFAQYQPVQVAVRSAGSETIYGAESIRWKPDGSFDGHLVLYVPAVGRLLDATLQQYPEVPRSPSGDVPLVSPVPAEHLRHGAILAVPRGDHEVIYIPIAGDHSELLSHPTFTHAVELHRPTGVHLAANVFDMLRLPDLRSVAERSPYPRIHRLLDELGDAESFRDATGTYRFRVPSTGAELMITDVR